jgi:peptidoglycan hydrolase-like protein with peptidoglycan-binding domain
MGNRIALFTVTIGLSLVALVRADNNVREVQTKLSDEGLYFGEIDGAYSSDLAAALTRYQIRNGLPITGQLDVETSEALGAKPAVKPSAAASEQSSQTWQRLRRGERQTSTKRRETSSPSTETETDTEVPPRSAPAAPAPSSSDSTLPASPPPATTSEGTQPASAPAATAFDTGAPEPEFSTERLRDYVAAFVLAGLDRNVGAEVEFFGDRVDYYDQGTMDREKIRED